jgi:hypothetical protein
MLIGLDFDNTIAGYDRLFVRVARSDGLVGSEAEGWTKTQVRDRLRACGPEGERRWQRLQGRVYGAHMAEAELIPGVGAFLERCRDARVPVVIVSHKTEYGHFDPERINLRDAARAWLTTHGFFDPKGFGLSTGQVFFESTRAEKVARIVALGCSHFVDDLEEVFLEPGFPAATRRYLFAPGSAPRPQGSFTAFPCWEIIADAILGPCSA